MTEGYKRVTDWKLIIISKMDSICLFFLFFAILIDLFIQTKT